METSSAHESYTGRGNLEFTACLAVSKLYTFSVVFGKFPTNPRLLSICREALSSALKTVTDKTAVPRLPQSPQLLPPAPQTSPHPPFHLMTTRDTLLPRPQPGQA